MYRELVIDQFLLSCLFFFIIPVIRSSRSVHSSLGIYHWFITAYYNWFNTCLWSQYIDNNLKRFFIRSLHSLFFFCIQFSRFRSTFLHSWKFLTSFPCPRKSTLTLKLDEPVHYSYTLKMNGKTNVNYTKTTCWILDNLHDLSLWWSLNQLVCNLQNNV